MRPIGCITALATPFTPAGELDLDAWRRLLAMQLDGGVQGVVVAGSTGEAAMLFDLEYDTLLRTAVQVVGGRIPVLAGTGASGTARTIEQTRRAGALGADAALVVTPAYVRPTQSGLFAHFMAVADDGALPIVMYNVPGRTGCDLLPETVARLCTHPRIVGIKEARDDAARMQALLALQGPSFAVLTGDDPTAARAQLAGAKGLVSVASNIVPAAMRRLCDLARNGDAAAAQALDLELQPLYGFLSVESNPIPLKALLAFEGIGHGLRLPLTTLDPANSAAAQRVAHDIRIIESNCRDLVAA